MSQIVIIPEIQIDFEDLSDAYNMEKYCAKDLGLKSIINENPIMLSIYDVPENKLSTIRRRCAFDSFSRGTVKIISKTRKAAVTAADFATCRVAAPVVQAGIKATLGIAGVAAKATCATGATLIGSTLENACKVKQELKMDPEVIHAKQELKGAYKSLKNLFGFSGSESVRIVK